MKLESNHAGTLEPLLEQIRFTKHIKLITSKASENTARAQARYKRNFYARINPTLPSKIGAYVHVENDGYKYDASTSQH